MPLIIQRNDITHMQVDAIVNAANGTLLGGGGVDGAIHRAAGPELTEACSRLGGCATGDAKVTPGFRLPCKYVIHTVGPVWRGGGCGEREKLASCYLRCLGLALQYGCETIAFPLISSGAYGYPKEEALSVAHRTISQFLLEHDMTVYIVVYDRKSFELTSRYHDDIAAFIDDHYIHAHRDHRANRCAAMYAPSMAAEECCAAPSMAMPKRQAVSLEHLVQEVEESFSEMLLRKIDESGLKDSQVYKKANIDRKLFHKIRSDKHYKPSKPTAIAFAIALELPMAETRKLLSKAGFALSRASVSDIIVEYFIRNGNYDIMEINMALFDFDQAPLGC